MRKVADKMTDMDKAPERITGEVWLRRADQATAAVIVAASLVAVIFWWWSHGGLQRRLVEWDASRPQIAKFQVDVNTAEWPELAQLPGIGPMLAQRIIEVRETSGPFTDASSLRRVRGIGPITLKRIEPYLLPPIGSKSMLANEH